VNPAIVAGTNKFREAAAESVEQNRDVFVFVGVDADDDIVARRSFMVGTAVGLLRRSGLGSAGRANRTAMGPGCVRLL
jgi:hypothetical protein